MNIYNFMNQKYREWKRSGRSSIEFPRINCVATNPLRNGDYIFLKDIKNDKQKLKEK